MSTPFRRTTGRTELVVTRFLRSSVSRAARR
jgi:hypothetical protein